MISDSGWLFWATLYIDSYLQALFFDWRIFTHNSWQLVRHGEICYVTLLYPYKMATATNEDNL